MIVLQLNMNKILKELIEEIISTFKERIDRIKILKVIAAVKVQNKLGKIEMKLFRKEEINPKM